MNVDIVVVVYEFLISHLLNIAMRLTNPRDEIDCP